MREDPKQQSVIQQLPDLENAIDRGWVEVFYQPILRTISRKVCGYEALARIRVPEHGIYPAEQFVPILEQEGRIHKLDSYLLQQVCREIQKLVEMKKPVPFFTVNLSMTEPENYDLLKMVEDAVRETGIQKKYLKLEVSERWIRKNPQLLTTRIQELRGAGYEVWLDDFGREEISLQLLMDASFDHIKLDMEMLREDTPKAREVVASLIALSKKLPMRTQAECVENWEQFDYLRKKGCEMVQGNLFGEPMPMPKLLQHLKKYGITPEGEDWKDYYDKLSELDYMTDRAMAITEYNGREFNCLFANDLFLEVWQSLGIQDLNSIYQSMNSEGSELGRQLREFQLNLKPGDEFKTLESRVRGYAVRVLAKIISVKGEQIAEQVEIENLTQGKMEPEAREREYVSQNLYNLFDSVFIVDPISNRFENVLVQNVGDPELFSYCINTTLDEASARLAENFIYVEDREEYLEWTNRETILKLMEANEQTSITHYFRTKAWDSSYIWKAHHILFLHANQKIVYASSLAPLYQKGLFNKLAPAYITHPRNNSMDSVLWKSLMESRAINLFWKDKNRRFLGANQKFLDTFGLKDESAILGKTDEDMNWHIDNEPFLEDELGVLTKGQVVVNRPGKCVIRGVVHDILATKEPLYEDGEIVGLFGYFMVAEDLLQGTLSNRVQRVRDPITGVMAAHSMMSLTMEYIEGWELKGEEFGMISIKVRQYSKLLQSESQEAAEELLRIVAEAIESTIPVSAVCARVFEDHFMVIQKTNQQSELQKLKNDIKKLLQQIRQIGPCEVKMDPKLEVYLASQTDNVMKMMHTLSEELYTF